MTKAGEKLIAAAEEMVAIAKGEQPAAAIWHNGHRYVPEIRVAEEGIADLTQALAQCQKALALLIDPEAIRKSRVQDGWAAAVAAEARARAALEKARR
jgi:hypothetical protein